MYDISIEAKIYANLRLIEIVFVQAVRMCVCVSALDIAICSLSPSLSFIRSRNEQCFLRFKILCTENVHHYTSKIY